MSERGRPEVVLTISRDASRIRPSAIKKYVGIVRPCRYGNGWSSVAGSGASSVVGHGVRHEMSSGSTPIVSTAWLRGPIEPWP